MTMRNIDVELGSEGRLLTAGRGARAAATLTFAIMVLATAGARAEGPSPPAQETSAPAPAASPALVAMTTPAPPETPAVAATAPPAAAVVPPVPPPPYSIPWQLRPVTVGTVIRSDTAVAFYDNAMGSGSTVATMLLGSYKLTPNLAPLVRMGFVQNGPPGTAPEGSSFVNPVVGLTYSQKIAGSFRFAGFFGATVPIGMGGGSAPDAGAAGANAAGIAARSAMDNAMFAVNYLTLIPGVGFAYIDHKLTVQVEATLLQLLRVKGDDSTGISPDGTRTNATAGIHAGYFIVPALSLGGELRYQRWLSTPTQIVMGVKSDFPAAKMDTVSFAIGPRFHFKVGRTWLRPGISYAQVVDQPLSSQHYKIVQIDVPVVF
jgi:hypothetical protein